MSHTFTQPFPPVYTYLVGLEIVTAHTTSPWLNVLICLACLGIPGPIRASAGKGTGCIWPSALTRKEYALKLIFRDVIRFIFIFLITQLTAFHLEFPNLVRRERASANGDRNRPVMEGVGSCSVSEADCCVRLRKHRPLPLPATHEVRLLEQINHIIIKTKIYVNQHPMGCCFFIAFICKSIKIFDQRLSYLIQLFPHRVFLKAVNLNFCNFY